MASAAPVMWLSEVAGIRKLGSATPAGPTSVQAGGGPSCGAVPPATIDGVARSSSDSTPSRAFRRGLRGSAGFSQDRTLSIQEDIFAAPVAVTDSVRGPAAAGRAAQTRAGGERR